MIKTIRLLPLFSAALLGLAAATTSLSEAQEDDSLENSSWQLVAIYSLADSVFTPRNPENYLLRFRLQNRLQIEADCNQAGATWNQDGAQLSLNELVTTRKLCPSPSLFNRYIMNLERVVSLTREENRLILQTNNEAEWLEFEPYVYTPNF